MIYLFLKLFSVVSFEFIVQLLQTMITDIMRLLQPPKDQFPLHFLKRFVALSYACLKFLEITQTFIDLITCLIKNLSFR